MRARIIICVPLELYKQPGAWLIRKIDKGSGSHVAIEFSSGEGVHVYEAVWPKVKKSTYHEWSKHYSEVKAYSFQISEENMSKVYLWLESQIGRRYSIPQLVLILIDLINPKNYGNINGKSDLVCSELSFEFAEQFLDGKIDESQDTFGVLDTEKLYELILKSRTSI